MGKRKYTDLEKIKAMAINFLMLTPKPTEFLPELYVDHPFFENRMLPMTDVKMSNHSFFDILQNEEELNKYRERYKADIMKATDVDWILVRILKKYHLAFLKYTRSYFNSTDFDRIFAEVWFTSENPNQDANVDIKTLISWFKSADRRNLMTQEEYNYYMSLPNEVQIYRGVANGRAAAKGLSWTCNLNTAQWFAKRFGPGGYIICGIINKEDIFAYFNRRNEDEICCNSSKVKIINKMVV